MTTEPVNEPSDHRGSRTTAEAGRVTVAPDPDCGHRALIGQSCQRCALGMELDGASDEWNRIVDWPVGGVQLTVNDVGRMASGLSIYRLPSGALAFRRSKRDGADVVEPPHWDRGYRVVGQDGRYPTWWPTADQAKQAAFLRQKLRALPRVGGHWISNATAGTPYGRLKVNSGFAELFGYVKGGGRRNRWILAHRASFIVFHGRLPAGGTVEHWCKRKRCANPDCLGEATRVENEARELPGTLYGVVRRDKLEALQHQFRPEWASARRW